MSGPKASVPEPADAPMEPASQSETTQTLSEPVPSEQQVEDDSSAEPKPANVSVTVTAGPRPSSSSASHKRELESPDSAEPPASRQRIGAVSGVLSVEDANELCDQFNDPELSFEVLMASYMQKKTSKEVPYSNNHPDLQSLVDESKKAEWSTLMEKSKSHSLR